jgi:hypothetical protein
MFDDLTWDAILQAWPWFGAAAVVFVVAVGLLIAFKRKSERQLDKTKTITDKREWTLTGRIDFADTEPVGALVLEVEETRISNSPSGVEHREIRWLRATLPEAKMVIESYHAQQNLPMSATFAPTATAGTKRHVNGQADSVETELRDVANGHEDVTLVPQTPWSVSSLSQAAYILLVTSQRHDKSLLKADSDHIET